MALGSCFLLLKRTSGPLNSKGFFFDDASNSKRTSYHEFQNKFNQRKSYWIWTRFQERFVTEFVTSLNSCSLLKFGKWFLSILHGIFLTCASQNMKSVLLVSLDNSSTLLFILDNSALKIVNCCWLVHLPVFPAFVHKKKFNEQEVVKLLRR